MVPSFEEMRKTAYNLAMEERKLAKAEHEAYELKLDLVRARDDLDREISVTSLAAYNDGRVDGKNEGQRKLQLDAILAETQTIHDLRQIVLKLEDQAGRLELQLGYIRALVRYRRNVFDAALASLRVSSTEVVHVGHVGEMAKAA